MTGFATRPMLLGASDVRCPTTGNGQFPRVCHNMLQHANLLLMRKFHKPSCHGEIVTWI